MSYQDEIQLRNEVKELEATVAELKSNNAITADQKLRKWAVALVYKHGGDLTTADKFVNYVKTGSQTPQDDVS